MKRLQRSGVGVEGFGVGEMGFFGWGFDPTTWEINIRKAQWENVIPSLLNIKKSEAPFLS